MGSARNYINVLTSEVIVACGAGGAGTASEIALALKSNKFVVLFNSSEADSVSKTVEVIRLLLARMGKSSTRTIKRQI
jgi:hypothetical protein